MFLGLVTVFSNIKLDLIIFQLCPEDTEDYIEYLSSIGKLDEGAVKLAYIVNKEDFVSKHGKSNHQLWNELCELISKNPDKVRLVFKNITIFSFVHFLHVQPVHRLCCSWRKFEDLPPVMNGNAELQVRNYAASRNIHVQFYCPRE